MAILIFLLVAIAILLLILIAKIAPEDIGSFVLVISFWAGIYLLIQYWDIVLVTFFVIFYALQEFAETWIFRTTLAVIGLLFVTALLAFLFYKSNPAFRRLCKI